MNISRKSAVIMVTTVLVVGMAVGFFVSRASIGIIYAQNNYNNDGEIDNVDEGELDDLYEAAFHRPADAEGKRFHLGRNLKDVLRDFNNSPEMRYYGALFKAVKAYEEAVRAPGILTAAEKQSYLDLIDSALSNLLAWVATLPDQDICKATVGVTEAREAIQAAYDNMSPAAKAAAEKGIFNALKQLGKPKSLAIYPKCLRPSVSPTPTASPSPTASPTTSPTVTPTPTATPTPTP